MISTLISTCQSVEVGKLSLEAQSGSLFGTLPRSSVRSMQVASSESDSGSGSIGSPGVTTVTPMATIAEDRGTELSFLEAADVFVGRFSYEFLRKYDTGGFDCFMFFLLLPLNQPRFQICKKQHEEQSLQIGPKNFGYSATSGGQGCVSFYPSKVRGLLRLGADGVSVPGGTFGGQRSKCAAGAAGTSCQVSGSCATDERTGRFFHWEIREIVHLRLYFFFGGGE